jgi:hypothetical protein
VTGCGLRSGTLRRCRLCALSARGFARRWPACFPPAGRRAARRCTSSGAHCCGPGTASTPWPRIRERDLPVRRAWRLRSVRAEACQPRWLEAISSKPWQSWRHERKGHLRSLRARAGPTTSPRTGRPVRSMPNLGGNSSCRSPSVAGPSAGDPWLCEPASRQVCGCREWRLRVRGGEPGKLPPPLAMQGNSREKIRQV